MSQQGKAGEKRTEEQAQSRQAGASTSTIDSDSRTAAPGKEAALPAGSLPVFKIPGLSLTLPTSVGRVDFSPLFLSKEQLHATWVRSLTSLITSRHLSCDEQHVQHVTAHLYMQIGK